MIKFLNGFLGGGFILPMAVWYMFIAFGVFYFSHPIGIGFGILSITSIIYSILWSKKIDKDREPKK